MSQRRAHQVNPRRSSGGLSSGSPTGQGSRGRGWSRSLALPIVSEATASLIGFGVLVHLARRLGPSSFADFEYASAVAAWWLVLVRGGFDAIAYREASRRPRLVGPITDLLLGLRLASAVVGLGAVAGLAWSSGPARGPVVIAAGLVLIPSALAADVAARASGRFGALALAQVVRAIGLAIGAGWLVSGEGDAKVAAACLVGAEIGSSLVLLLSHAPAHGLAVPRFRRRAWSVLARRGAVAGAGRFARVSLYQADILALGALATSALGPYAAARRLSFALLALGLAIPTAMAPRIARAWASGAEETRVLLGRTFEGLASVSLPATVGLMATSDRWMPRLFGEGFREGGPWLTLIAARLPFVLASNLQQVALIACRREAVALRLVGGMAALGLATLPVLAWISGPWALGLAALAIEAAGAVGGWFALRRIGLAPAWDHGARPAVLGCLALLGICLALPDRPLGPVVVAGVVAYALAWRLAR